MYDAVFEAAEKVVTFEDFIEFMLVLESEFKKNGSGWENQRIDNFMEAAAGWAVDEHERDNKIANPSWRNIATILSSGMIYE